MERANKQIGRQGRRLQEEEPMDTREAVEEGPAYNTRSRGPAGAEASGQGAERAPARRSMSERGLIRSREPQGGKVGDPGSRHQRGQGADGRRSEGDVMTTVKDAINDDVMM